MPGDHCNHLLASRPVLHLHALVHAGRLSGARGIPITGDMDWAVNHLLPWLGKGIRRLTRGFGIPRKRPVPTVVPQIATVRLTEQQFEGRIAGLGSTSGVRVVVGWWRRTPWGEFTDVMVEDPAGHRALLAPDRRVADLLERTYAFDEVVTGPLEVAALGRAVRVHGPGLDLGFTVGRRTMLGSCCRRCRAGWPPPRAG